MPDSLSPSLSPNDDISEVSSSFNSGKRNKSKTPAVKSETLVDLMLNKLELEITQRGERELKEAEQYAKDEQQAERQERRAEEEVRE